MNYKTRCERRAPILERDRDGHRLTFHCPTRLIRYWIHPRCIKALLIQRNQPVSAGLNNVSVLQRYGMTSNSSSSDVGASSMTSNIAPLLVLHHQRSATILQRKYVKYSQVTPSRLLWNSCTRWFLVCCVIFITESYRPNSRESEVNQTKPYPIQRSHDPSHGRL